MTEEQKNQLDETFSKYFKTESINELDASMSSEDLAEIERQDKEWKEQQEKIRAWEEFHHRMNS